MNHNNKTTEEFLADLQQKFGGENKEIVKVVELKRWRQRGRIMEEFVQEFRRAVRGSRYKGKLLVEEFKRKMNSTICQRLMESEWQPTFIEQ